MIVYGITCSEEGGGGRQFRENSLSFMFTTLIRLKVPYNVWVFFRVTHSDISVAFYIADFFLFPSRKNVTSE